MEMTRNKAAERFDKLWEIESSKLLRGEIMPSAMENGEIYPVDYCVSTIARLIRQPFGKEIVIEIRRKLSDLFKIADMQYIYPDESLHISLLGCTQRAASADSFDRDQINKIKDICISEVKKKKPAEIILKGVGIIGNQIFTQGFPVDATWEELRTAMTDKLVSSGENPISYEDKSPIHINIIRIVSSDHDLLLSLHKVISQLRDVELGCVKLRSIDYVITDFCVSKKHVVWLDQMECNGADVSEVNTL